MGQMHRAGSEACQEESPGHWGTEEENFYRAPEISLLNRKRVVEDTEPHRGIELLKRQLVSLSSGAD